jgi:hypothetical protein
MGFLGDVEAVGEGQIALQRPTKPPRFPLPPPFDGASDRTAMCFGQEYTPLCARKREAEGDLRDQSWARRTGASEQAEQPGGRKGARAARAASNGRSREGAEPAKNEAVDAGERDDEMKREKKEEEEEEGERERIESFGDGRTFERSTLQAAVVGHSRARRDGD